MPHDLQTGRDARLLTEAVSRDFPHALPFLDHAAGKEHMLIALPHQGDANTMITDAVAAALESWNGWPWLHNLSRMSPSGALSAVEDLLDMGQDRAVAALPPMGAEFLATPRMQALLDQRRMVLIVPVPLRNLPASAGRGFAAIAMREGGRTVFRTRNPSATALRVPGWTRLRETAKRVLRRPLPD